MSLGSCSSCQSSFLCSFLFGGYLRISVYKCTFTGQCHSILLLSHLRSFSSLRSVPLAAYVCLHEWENLLFLFYNSLLRTVHLQQLLSSSYVGEGERQGGFFVKKISRSSLFETKRSFLLWRGVIDLYIINGQKEIVKYVK